MEDLFDRPIGLNNIPDVVRMRQFKNAKEFPYDGIWLFSGSQGSGKTLLMMHVVRDIHRMYPDALIVSNISIFGIPCIPYRGIEDFDRYQNGDKGIIYVLDEIQTMYNSLESAKMPPSTLAVWSQNRKNRRVILGTSQRFTRVAKGLREQTKWLINCRRALLWFYPYRVYDGADFDEYGKYVSSEDEKEPRVRWYVPEKSVMLMYNTMEVVQNGDNL